MTNPPTIIDRLMSLCIIYMLVTTVLSTIGILLVILVPVFKGLIGVPTLYIILSTLGAGIMWFIFGIYKDFRNDLDKIPGYFRKQWKIATWREEEGIEE